jgi:hypothetical protein
MLGRQSPWAGMHKPMTRRAVVFISGFRT